MEFTSAGSLPHLTAKQNAVRAKGSPFVSALLLACCHVRLCGAFSSQRSLHDLAADDSAQNANESYVFLQKFPLAGSAGMLFHTEVLVCPQGGFSREDQDTLNGKIAAMQDFALINESWWSSRNVSCVELGYGGNFCRLRCCGVPFRENQTHFALNARRAMIPVVEASGKSLYIYGTGAFDGVAAHSRTCEQESWTDWSGSDYNPLTNNCNTFTTMVLSCIYGLSHKKPDLSISDVIRVRCNATDPGGRRHELPA